ncbi:CHAT domain-containing protein [Micromonospora sp. WMMC264]|uniref:CHAT domain-containing protein n=1 Tax=Micromonospora sp. WMMC264 TaxID=3015158 RepID=UPI00248AAAE1|nr:CHAT domain-containing protein [Micromonospora sp. WMMC264]WBB88177.1 CHAT domain-containing protein [Micromonospora sp. WMMC264]
MPDRMALAAAVRAATTGSEAWVSAMDDLAESWAGDGELDNAISIRRQALEGLGAQVPASMRLDLSTNLGIDLMDRYRRDCRIADLREACAIAERVWAASPPAGRLEATANLAGRLAARSDVPGEPDSLDRARQLLEDALMAATTDDPERPVAISALAGVHLQLWRRGGDRRRLDAALRTVTAGLQPATAGPEMVNVAGLVAEAAEQRYDRKLLALAEQLARSAITVGRPATATVRVALHRLLASVLLTRYEWTGERDALTEASVSAQNAVREATVDADRVLALSVRSTVRSVMARLRGDQPGFAAAIADACAALDLVRGQGRDGEYATNLASLLAERYDLRGDSTDLDEAITLLDRVLAEGVDRDTRPAVFNNQANNLLARFELRAEPADLDRAIALAEEAVEATALDSWDLAARHDSAGRLHAARAHHRGSRDDLVTAERHAEQAVAASREGSPDLALYLNNWAMWLTDRWEQDGAEDALSHAIDRLQQALAAADRAEDDIEGSMTATIAFNLGARLQDRFDLDLRRGRTDMETLQRAADLLDEVLGAGYPHLAVVAGRRLGDIAWRVGMWPEAEQAFGAALEAAGTLTGMRPRHPDKERARSGVQGIGALAALAAVRAGDAAAAAVHLEQASATLIAEATGIHADTVSFAGIVAAAADMDRHVLLLGCTRAGGVAVLVAPNGSAQYAELPQAIEPAVADQASRFREALRRAEDSPDAMPILLEAADQFAAWTLDSLVAPLLPLVATAGRLAVLPLGRLAWLPLTTCGVPGERAALGAYDPILLIRATAPSRKPPAKAPAVAPRVVVWADTSPADRPIPAAGREAARVARRHAGAVTRIDRNAATGGVFADDTVLDGLLAADIAHLACHCDVDVDHPQQTVLRVRPPIRVGLRAHSARRRVHVVLSACDAALTGAALPDEALSAATAFLLAGAAVVTAPLWPVNDTTAPALMSDYHAELAAGVPPAAALSAVQKRWARRPAYVYGPWVVTAWPDTADG